MLFLYGVKMYERCMYPRQYIKPWLLTQPNIKVLLTYLYINNDIVCTTHTVNEHKLIIHYCKHN